MTIARKALHIGATALMLSTIATVTTFVSADAAYAERGGNGNGNGNARGRDRERPNANRNNGNRGNGNGNGNGAIASELKWLNASNASQNALENASPNSRPGQLYVFQQEYAAAQQSISDAEANELTAQQEYDRLIGLTEEEIAAEFPEGGYEDAVTNAAIALEDAQGAVTTAESSVNDALLVLTGGRELSEGALAELLSRLGLE